MPYIYGTHLSYLTFTPLHRAYFFLFVVLRAYLKVVRGLSQSIFGKFRYGKSFIWWEISQKLIFKRFSVYLNLGCPEIISRHPKLRYTKKVLKISFRLISHQINDFLYLNFPNMDCESYLTTLRYALSTTNNKKYAQCNGAPWGECQGIFFVIRGAQGIS